MELVVNYPFIKGDKDIFTATIAKMFHQFKIQVDGGEMVDNDKRETITIFQQVFEDIKVLNGTYYNMDEMDSIEQLVLKSNATDIEKHFKNLFRKTGYKVRFEVSPLYELNGLELRDIDRIKSYQS